MSARSQPAPSLLTRISTLDELLASHAAEMGKDAIAYRNHVYRVANFCVALSSGEPGPLEKIAIAAALHDMGIWSDHTFDYLGPSVKLARAHLAAIGRMEWTDELTEMILEHHKLTPCRASPHSLVETFRRADLLDLSKGLFSFGLSRSYLHQVFSTWPNAGFHARLVQLFLSRLREHPLNPLPMYRL